jgi:hypothetical protein
MPKRGPADPQLLGKVALRGQGIAGLIAAVFDQFADALQGLFGDGAG